MTPMTQDEIKEYYQDRQSNLSRNFYTALTDIEQAIKKVTSDFDKAMLEDRRKATVIKFKQDCRMLEEQQRTAIISAMPKGGTYWMQFKLSPQELHTVAA